MKYTFRTQTCVTLLLLPFLAISSASVSPPAVAQTRKSVRKSAPVMLGTVSGVVLSMEGSPLEDVVVQLVRGGLQFGGSRIMKEVRTGKGGGFRVQAVPGSYELKAQAEGFSPASVGGVELNQADDLVVRFNLQPSGFGRTLPETRAERDNPKWRIKSAQSRRSVFQVDESTSVSVSSGELAVNGEAADVTDEEIDLMIYSSPCSEAKADCDKKKIRAAKSETARQEETAVGAREAERDVVRERKRASRVRGAVETYLAVSENPLAPMSRGVNVAVAVPYSARTDFTFVGQAGTLGSRFEARARRRLTERHKAHLSAGYARLAAGGEIVPANRGAVLDSQSLPIIDALIGAYNAANTLNSDASGGLAGAYRSSEGLAQVSLRGADEWIVRDGVVVLIGVDYTQFLIRDASGKGGARRISPRFGVSLDANARTRVSAAYAEGDSEAAQSVAAFEGQTIAFKDSPSPKPIVKDGNGVAQIERTNRLQFGIERVLDERSQFEITAFFDTTNNRGVGLLALPSNDLRATNNDFTRIVEQQGAARGVRVLLARRVNKNVSLAAGYSFGLGQKLNDSILIDDADDAEATIFRNAFFHSAAAQIDADLTDTTNVRAVLRFSSRATVFAIDPFAGELAVYDPSLSVLVTQELPTFGLPLRAKAVIDARNLFDFATATSDGESALLVGALRRSVRGGIAVRF